MILIAQISVDGLSQEQELATLSVKGWTVNSLGFVSHTGCHNHIILSLRHEMNTAVC